MRVVLGLTAELIVRAIIGLAWAQRRGSGAVVAQEVPAAMQLTRDVSGEGLSEVARTVRAWSEGNGLTELAPPTLSVLPKFFDAPPTTEWKPVIHRGMPITTLPTTTTTTTTPTSTTPSAAATGTRVTTSRAPGSSSPTASSASSAASTSSQTSTVGSTSAAAASSTTTTSASTSTVATTTTAATTLSTSAATTTTTSLQFTKGSDRGGASYYDYKAGTCAHRTLPFGTVVRVTNVATGKSTTCLVADRGPFIAGRVIDLERRVFAEVASISDGVFQAEIAW